MLFDLGDLGTDSGQVGCQPESASSPASRSPTERMSRKRLWSRVALKSPATTVGPALTASASLPWERTYSSAQARRPALSR